MSRKDLLYSKIVTKLITAFHILTELRRQNTRLLCMSDICTVLIVVLSTLLKAEMNMMTEIDCVHALNNTLILTSIQSKSEWNDGPCEVYFQSIKFKHVYLPAACFQTLRIKVTRILNNEHEEEC